MLLFNNREITKTQKLHLYFQNKDGQSIAKRKLVTLEKINDKRIRVFKLDRQAQIKNFVYSIEPQKEILAIVPGEFWGLPYVLHGDGIHTKSAYTFPPENDGKFTIGDYTGGSSYAVIENQLYIFGGWHNGRKV